MLKRINKTTLFVTMAFVSGSFLKAIEPVLALEATAADQTKIAGVEVYEPRTMFSIEALELNKAKAFLADLAELAAKHQLSNQTIKTMLKEGAISLASTFASKNGISEQEALAAIELIISEMKSFDNLTNQLLVCDSVIDSTITDDYKAVKAMLGEEVSDLVKSLKDLKKAPNFKDAALILSKISQYQLKSQTQLIMPIGILLTGMPELPADVKQEVLNLLLLKQFPELKNVLKFEICKANDVEPEFVISWVSEHLDKAIVGTYETSEQAVLAMVTTLQKALDKIGSLTKDTKEQITKCFKAFCCKLWKVRNQKIDNQENIERQEADLKNLASKVFGKNTPVLLEDFAAVVQAVE